MASKLSVGLTADARNTWICRSDRWRYTNMANPAQFKEYCLSWLPPECTVAVSTADATDPPSRSHDIVVGGLREFDVAAPSGSIGVLLSCEDCLRRHPAAWGYKHYCKHGDVGDPNVNICFYNHHSTMKVVNNVVIVPFVYLYVSYLKRHYATLRPKAAIPFDKRKFCIITTNNYPAVQAWLRRIGPCDHINNHKSLVAGATCYHGQALIDLLGRYKFVFCAENSFHAGYITEKVFNAFYARTVPIYMGPPDTFKFLNREAVVAMSSHPTKQTMTNTLTNIRHLMSSPTAFTKTVSAPKLSRTYTDEHYEMQLRGVVRSWIKKNAARRSTNSNENQVTTTAKDELREAANA
jgi:hypothetical protein